MRTRAAILHELGLPQPYAESRPLRIEEIEFDSPAAGEVVVRIASAGLCHSDLSNLNGTMPKETPLALGHEAAGVVEEIGAGVTYVKPGDHVIFAFVAMCGECAMCVAGKPALCIPGHAANRAGGILRGGTRFRLHGKPGITNPAVTVPLAPLLLVGAERTLRGSFMGASVPRRDIPKYIGLWRSGKLPIQRLLSGTIGLDGLNEAFDRPAAGEVVRTMCIA